MIYFVRAANLRSRYTTHGMRALRFHQYCRPCLYGVRSPMNNIFMMYGSLGNPVLTNCAHTQSVPSHSLCSHTDTHLQRLCLNCNFLVGQKHENDWSAKTKKKSESDKMKKNLRTSSRREHGTNNCDHCSTV